MLEGALVLGEFANEGREGLEVGLDGAAARDDFSARLSATDLVAQAQDNREHDILDSDDYYQFMGGLLKHAPALAAVCAPTVNSYKRLVVGRSLTGATWAPAYITYGDNNRSSMIRIPKGRLELRLPDGAANPYLATAAVIAAGLDGIDRQLDPGVPRNTNLYEWSEQALADAGIGLLPQNLGSALDALQADALICDALGPVSQEFLKLKRMEWLEYQRHVSDWEIKQYLEFF